MVIWTFMRYYIIIFSQIFIYGLLKYDLIFSTTLYKDRLLLLYNFLFVYI